MDPPFELTPTWRKATSGPPEEVGHTSNMLHKNRNALHKNVGGSATGWNIFEPVSRLSHSLSFLSWPVNIQMDALTSFPRSSAITNNPQDGQLPDVEHNRKATPTHLGPFMDQMQHHSAHLSVTSCVAVSSRCCGFVIFETVNLPLSHLHGCSASGSLGFQFLTSVLGPCPHRDALVLGRWSGK